MNKYTVNTLLVHICHISHEMKSHRIWPIWKQFLIRFFKFHIFFQPSYNIFYEEININHTLLCLSQASYIKANVFDYFGGRELHSVFCKNLTECYQISFKNALSHRFQSTAYGMYDCILIYMF